MVAFLSPPGSHLSSLNDDHRNRLTKIVFRDAANETTSNIISQVWQGYDALDRRLTRQNVNASGTVVNYDNYVYDGWDVVADYLITPAGASYYEIFRYFWAPSDKPGDTSILVAQEWLYGQGYQNRFMLNDHQNSVKDVLGSNGELNDIVQRQHFVYDAYGKLIQVVAAGGTGTNPLTRYQYTSQEFDSTTNLLYSNHRFLHVQTGTWQTEDPLEFGAGDTNLRRYVGNNSPNATDPSGLEENKFQPFMLRNGTIVTGPGRYEDTRTGRAIEYNSQGILTYDSRDILTRERTTPESFELKQLEAKKENWYQRGSGYSASPLHHTNHHFAFKVCATKPLEYYLDAIYNDLIRFKYFNGEFNNIATVRKVGDRFAVFNEVGNFMGVGSLIIGGNDNEVPVNLKYDSVKRE